MSYDAWKTTDPREAEPPAWTCDCGEPIDPTCGVSMCRGCFDSCEPAEGEEEGR